MSTVIANRTIVTPKDGDYFSFWPNYGKPRIVRHGERFTVTRSRPSSLGGRTYEIMDIKGNTGRWYPAHRFDVVE